MRTESSIKNLIAALCGQLFGSLISLAARIIFLKYLNEEYLGLNGLFTNIITMLSLVELGVGPAMTFSLYKPLAENDVQKIKSLMALYRKAYILIGIAVLVIGIGFTNFYTIFLDEIPNIPQLDLIYILFVSNTAISYLYSYKRSLIICDQKRYIATIYRYGFYIVLNIVQILILAATQNYILFLICQIFFTWLENFAVSLIADKMYPYLKDKNIDKLDKVSITQIKKNISAMVLHKIGGIMVMSTDNIILSKFVGLVWVGLYSNYYLVISALETIVSQVFTSIVASVGSLTAADDKKKLIEVFNKTFFIGFWISALSSICLLILFNPFVELWIGRKYLLDFSVVLVLVINYYITVMRKASLTFREASGTFWQDRYKPLFESAINIAASIILAKKLGIAGVFIGTIISTMTTCFWVEPLVLYKYVFNEGLSSYILRYCKYTLIGLAAALITYLLCSFITEITMLTLVIRFGICLSVPNLIFFFIFYKTEEFQYFFRLLKRILTRFKKKG